MTVNDTNLPEKIYMDHGKQDIYIYNPPAWKVCETCAGTGHVYREVQSAAGSKLDGNTYNIVGECLDCIMGRIPIRYTPEQWQKAGGILSEDTQIWHDGGAGIFRIGSWRALKGINPNGWIIIIAIPGQDRPDAGWRPE